MFRSFFSGARTPERPADIAAPRLDTAHLTSAVFQDTLELARISPEFARLVEAHPGIQPILLARPDLWLGGEWSPMTERFAALRAADQRESCAADGGRARFDGAAEALYDRLAEVVLPLLVRESGDPGRGFEFKGPDAVLEFRVGDQIDFTELFARAPWINTLSIDLTSVRLSDLPWGSELFGGGSDAALLATDPEDAVLLRAFDLPPRGGKSLTPLETDELLGHPLVRLLVTKLSISGPEVSEEAVARMAERLADKFHNLREVRCGDRIAFPSTLRDIQ